MKGRGKDPGQVEMFERSLSEMVDPRPRFCRLAAKIPGDILEQDLGELYSHTGKPSKPVRLMVSLLLLQQMYDLSDEAVAEGWLENPHYQYFSGETTFQWIFPCHPTDPVRF